MDNIVLMLAKLWISGKIIWPRVYTKMSDWEIVEIHNLMVKNNLWECFPISEVFFNNLSRIYDLFNVQVSKEEFYFRMGWVVWESIKLNSTQPLDKICKDILEYKL